jgi:hypothetical protein
VTLHLVKDEPPTPRHRRDRGRRQLTDVQVQRLKLTTRNLVRAYGSPDCLAEVTGLAVDTIHDLQGRRRGRFGTLTAMRIAKAAGVTVEHLLSGKFTLANQCPTCGAEGRAA